MPQKKASTAPKNEEQNQPEAKTKGIIMALAGIVMTALKSILKSLGVISA